MWVFDIFFDLVYLVLIVVVCLSDFVFCILVIDLKMFEVEFFGLVVVVVWVCVVEGCI